MNYASLFHVTLPETALDVAALLVLFVDLGFLRKAAVKIRLAAAVFLGSLGCAGSLFAVLTTGPEWLTYGKDGQSALLATGGFVTVAQIGILVLTGLTLLLLFESDFTKHVGEFVAVILMSAAGGLLIAAAQDLLVIFIGLELLSLGLYILTAFAKKSGNSAEGAMKYYLFGGMSAAFLLFGFSYFYGLTGSTSLQTIQYKITLAGASPLLYMAWIMVATGLGFKVAVVPFHMWAPDAYEGSPAPGGAFIASVSKVASFALLISLAANWWLRPGGSLVTDAASLEQFLQSYYKTWPPLANVLLIASAASMVLGNLAALAQSSVRRLLAYSAIAHGGYILLGLAAHPLLSGQSTAVALNASAFFPTLRGMESVLYYVLTYGLTTIGAFGVVAVVERATGSDRFDAFIGLRKRNPLLSGILLILVLSLAGIPPLVGFWAKFNLFAAVLGEHGGTTPFALVCLAIAMSAVSLYYYLQILKRAYVVPALDQSPIRMHPVTALVLIGIAVLVILLGIFPGWLGSWIQGF